MKRTFTLLLFILFFCAIANAQNGSYDQKAEEVRLKIWGDKSPEFDVKAVPTEMEKESAVIIAQYMGVEQTTTGKLKIGILFNGSVNHTNRVTTFRERVKINDKVALEKYSSLEYQKSLDKTKGLLTIKLYNKKDTYIGAKIIKANGKEVIVNTSEEVLTKSEAKDSQGKLAISGLQVGDILDYYICKVETLENAKFDSKGDDDKHLFVLTDEYPILNYHINLQYNKKCNVYYVVANHAPDFVTSTTDNGDQTYDLRIKNLKKYTNNMWTQPLRQYPYIELISTFNSRTINVLQNYKYDKNEDRLTNAVRAYEEMFKEAKILSYDQIPVKLMKRYFKSNKEYKSAPLDSSMRILYDAWKYTTFCYYDGKEMDMSRERNTMKGASQFNTIMMTHYLHDLNIDYDILLVSPVYDGTLDNVFDKSDLKALIRINDGDPLYMCFDDMYTSFNELPAEYQGQEVVVLSPHNRNFDKFDESRTTLPVINADKNFSSSKMQVSLLPENMQKIKVQRTVSEGGYLRHDDQRNLVLMETIDQTYTDILGGDDLSKRIDKGLNGKKLAVEYTAAFEKARTDIPKNFKDEAEGEFDEQPQQLTNYKVNDPGLNGIMPSFTYSSTFVMDNFVKKAGNNYILQVGKFIGKYTKMDDKERQRQVDIYMPAARSFNYDINLSIPKGYKVTGVEALAQQKKNETGLFKVVTSVKGDVLNIKVNRSYTHNFEKVTQWPKLLEIMDAAYNFTTQKILLEKI
jgi:hypothetical protein